MEAWIKSERGCVCVTDIQIDPFEIVRELYGWEIERESVCARKRPKRD